MYTKNLTFKHKEFQAEISLVDTAQSEYKVTIENLAPFYMTVHPRFGCVSITADHIDTMRFVEVGRAIISQYSLHVLVGDQQIRLGMTVDMDLQPQYLIPLPNGEFASYTPTKGIYWLGLRDCGEDYDEFIYAVCDEIDKHRATNRYNWNVE